MTNQRTPGEVFEAYAKLSDKGRRVLLGIACHYARGTGFGEPLDLLHEALIRTADGRRRWSMGIDFGAHMALAMRSIADTDRKLHANARAVGRVFEELLEWAEDALGSHGSAEFECAQAQEIQGLRRMIERAKKQWVGAGDVEAANVLDGMLADLDDAEIAKRLDMSPNAVRAAKKRILRKLATLAKL